MPPSQSKQKKHAKRPGKPPRKFANPSARRHIHRAEKKPAKSPAKRAGKLFEALVAVQARLRAPDGCPWDREQTHATLKAYLIEEAYETLDAIERANPQDMAEELGDLLLQVLFHADLARETGAFDISDVITGIHDKMIRRHPHVFGNVIASTPGEVLVNWAKLKAKEKQEASTKGESHEKPAPSALDGVPRNLPALLEAHQLTRRAAQVGFDWEQTEGIFEKLEEEIKELREALSGSDPRTIECELGDLLFTVVNLSRFLKHDPEVALKSCNQKFKQRFQEMESIASDSGQALANLSKEKLENLWTEAKRRERPQISMDPKQ